MGFRFTLGRIVLGLLMVVQGIIIMQGGFKDQLSQFRALRSYLNRYQEEAAPTDFGFQVFSLLATFTGAKLSDSMLIYLVYFQSIMMIVSGALVIANVRFGGLLMSIAMLSMIATRDNPVLSTNDVTWKLNFQSMLKDLAVAGTGVLIYKRKQTLRHRRNGGGGGGGTGNV
jgi:hypothetical protein